MQDEIPNITSYDQLLAEFDKFYLLKDRQVMRALIGTVVANQMSGNPNWLFIVGSSSGGKSALIQSLYDIEANGRPLFVPISDLTVNAFASGQKKVGKETSLLHRIPPGGILAFKDFTSMISKAKEAQAEIFKQLREIFDGSYVKRTGTGDDVNWKGKVGAIAGATEVIYEHQEAFSSMGDRFCMYGLIQPERKEVLKFLMSDERINADVEKENKYLRDCVKVYVSNIFDQLNEDDVIINIDVKRDLQEVADFCTRVRSGVVVDDHRSHIIKFVPSIEMPMRMLGQLTQLAKAFVVMRRTEPHADMKKAAEGFLSPEETAILYKIAFDSIPIKRRLALKLLANKPEGVTSKGLATALNYQTPVVASWMAQLNGLGVCLRDPGFNGNQGDKWILRPEFREVLKKFNQMEVTTEALRAIEEEAYQAGNEGFEDAFLGPTDIEETQLDVNFKDL